MLIRILAIGGQLKSKSVFERVLSKVSKNDWTRLAIPLDMVDMEVLGYNTDTGMGV